MNSVTRVLSVISQDYGPEDKVEIAAERGTRTHNVCIAHALRLFPCLQEDTAGYFQSFQGWWDDHVDQMMLEPEIELSDPKLGIMGHPDFPWLRLRSGHNTVLDLKTPIQYRRSWSLQLAAYWWLVKPVARIDLKPSVLMLDPYGGPAKLIWVEEKEGKTTEQLFGLFHQCLNISNFMNLEKEEVNDYEF